MCLPATALFNLACCHMAIFHSPEAGLISGDLLYCLQISALDDEDFGNLSDSVDVEFNGSRRLEADGGFGGTVLGGGRRVVAADFNGVKAESKGSLDVAGERLVIDKGSSPSTSGFIVLASLNSGGKVGSGRDGKKVQSQPEHPESFFEHQHPKKRRLESDPDIDPLDFIDLDNDTPSYTTALTCKTCSMLTAPVLSVFCLPFLARV